eukprot:jgi/Orpsp1_1/1176326/evm.model.c7180000057203.1
MYEIISYTDKKDFLCEKALYELYATGLNYTAAQELYKYKENLLRYNYCEFEENKFDIYQKLIEVYILNPFFPWLFLILILNRKKWKRPIIFILIFYWFFKSTSDLLTKILDSIYTEFCHFEYLLWPYNVHYWKLGCISNIFLKVSEIIGDWYILMRTKAVIRNSRKILLLYITCFLFNLTKLGDIFYRFYLYPNVHKSFIDFREQSPLEYQNGNIQKLYDLLNNFQDSASNLQIKLVMTLGIIQIASFFYDVSAIYCLRKHLFLKIKETDKKSFIEKFKQMSEFRIIISLIASIIFIPFIIYMIFIIIKLRKNEYRVGASDGDDDNLKIILNNEFNQVDNFRQVVVNINYTLMFIDQILLRFYAERMNPKYKMTSTNSYIYYPNSSGKNNELGSSGFGSSGLGSNGLDSCGINSNGLNSYNTSYNTSFNNDNNTHDHSTDHGFNNSDDKNIHKDINSDNFNENKNFNYNNEGNDFRYLSNKSSLSKVQLLNKNNNLPDYSIKMPTPAYDKYNNYKNR